MGTLRIRIVGMAGAAALLAGCNLGVSRAPVDVPAEGVATGDLDGDGIPDLAVAGEDEFSVLLGDGTGGWDVTSIPIADDANESRFFKVVLTDVERDGDLDAIAVQFSGEILGNGGFLYLNDGTGTFTFDQPVLVQGAEGDVVTGDMDGDGATDVAVETPGQFAAVYRGDGAGGFLPRLDLAPPIDGQGIDLADLNGDGRDDLVLGGSDATARSVAAVYLSTGTAFAAPVQYVADPARRESRGFATADMDGDGHLDIVAITSALDAEDDASLAVLPGRGDGTFGAAVVTPIVGGPTSAQLEVGDIDADGHPDVVAALRGRGAMVFFGDGAGSFPDSHYLAPSGGTATDLVVVDIDGDGVDDVVTAGAKPDVFLNRLDGARTHP